MKNPLIKINHDRREVFVRGRELFLPTKEYAILEMLIRTNKALTRDELLKEIWGHEEDVETRTVDQHVSSLRKKLGSHRNVIKTLPNHGYRYDGAKA